MSTAKEKVLAYFEEWAGFDNPENGYGIHHLEDDYSERIGICAGDDCILDFPINEKEDKYWEAAARILKLDTPKAAEIQWEEDIYPPEPEVNLPAQQEWQSECGFYIVQLKGDDYHAVYEEGDYHREADLGFHSTPEAAKQACQDHKQRRLEDLL